MVYKSFKLIAQSFFHNYTLSMFIAVCEDESAIRDYEKKLITDWALQKNISVSVDCYTSAENFLFESEDKLEYDLLLLDIQMGKMNGIDLAKTLRKRGFSGQLIFLTGVRDYAIEGYEVGAVRYILKPADEKNLPPVLDLVYEEYTKKSQEYFLLQIGNDVTKLPLEKIIYLEADGHYVHLLGTETEQQWKTSFAQATQGLETKGFFCLRRGLLVNLRHVTRITRNECILSTNETLPVARNNYDALNRAFIDFYRGAL